MKKTYKAVPSTKKVTASKKLKNRRIVSSDDEFSRMQSELAALTDEYSNPLYSSEDDCVAYFEGISYQVEEEMGLYVEPSVQAGEGDVWIFRDNACVAEGIDYEDFCYSLMNIYLESSSPADVKLQVGNYYESLLEEYAPEDEDEDY